jgi:hypothetical protein
VLLSCAEETDPYVEREPCLIAEVLSPTTEVIDRIGFPASEVSKVSPSRLER